MGNETYKTTPAGKAVINKYSDILNCSSPEPSYKHPRMSLSNRAKVLSPFAALRVYDEETKSEDLQLQLCTKLDLSKARNILEAPSSLQGYRSDCKLLPLCRASHSLYHTYLYSNISGHKNKHRGEHSRNKQKPYNGHHY